MTPPKIPYADTWSNVDPGPWKIRRADPVRPPDTDEEPSCCELACYEDPGCAGPGCEPYATVDDSRSGAVIVWMLGAIVAALIVVVGVWVATHE